MPQTWRSPWIHIHQEQWISKPVSSSSWLWSMLWLNYSQKEADVSPNYGCQQNTSEHPQKHEAAICTGKQWKEISIPKCLKRLSVRSLSFGKVHGWKTAAMTTGQNTGEKIKFDTCWFFCCWSLFWTPLWKKPKIYWIHSNTGISNATSVRSWQGKLH